MDSIELEDLLLERKSGFSVLLFELAPSEALKCTYHREDGPARVSYECAARSDDVPTVPKVGAEDLPRTFCDQLYGDRSYGDLGVRSAEFLVQRVPGSDGFYEIVFKEKR